MVWHGMVFYGALVMICHLTVHYKCSVLLLLFFQLPVYAAGSCAGMSANHQVQDSDIHVFNPLNLHSVLALFSTVHFLHLCVLMLYLCST